MMIAVGGGGWGCVEMLFDSSESGGDNERGVIKQKP